MKRILLDHFDVVSLKPKDSFSGTSTSKAVDLIMNLLNGYTGIGSVLIRLDKEILLGWLFNGIEAEVMQRGEDWKSGKIYVSIQFIPDEDEAELNEADKPQKVLPPSPLDDLRNQLRQANK